MTNRELSSGSRHPHRSDGGFTLIELLIVIVILGILATVVVFAVGGITDRGTDSARAADEKTLVTAEEAHYAQFGSYTDEPGLVTAGLLRDESDLHDIALSGDDYTVTYVGGGGSPALPQFGSGPLTMYFITGGSSALQADWDYFTSNCGDPGFSLKLIVDPLFDMADAVTTIGGHPPIPPMLPDPGLPFGVVFFADPSTTLGGDLDAEAFPNATTYVYPYDFGPWDATFTLENNLGC